MKHLNTLTELQERLNTEDARLVALQAERDQLATTEAAAKAALVAGSGDVSALTGASAARAALDDVVATLEAKIQATRHEVVVAEKRIEREQKLDSLTGRATATLEAKDAFVKAHAEFAAMLETGGAALMSAFDSYVQERARFVTEAAKSGLEPHELSERDVDTTGVSSVLLEGMLPEIPKDSWSREPLALQVSPSSGLALNLMLGELHKRHEEERQAQQQALHQRFPNLLDGGSSSAGTDLTPRTSDSSQPAWMQPYLGGEK